MLDVTQYVDSQLGKEVADPWGEYKGECVSLAQNWIKANGWAMRSGDAIQWAKQAGNGWVWTDNTPTGVPPAGSLVVFQVGTYGHIGIAMPGATASMLPLASQNWPKGNDTNPVAVADFNYVNPKCLGWLTYGDPEPAHKTVTVTAKVLNVRNAPNSSTGKVVKQLSVGQVETVLETVTGTSVDGNANWYEIAPSQFISAYWTK